MQRNDSNKKIDAMFLNKNIIKKMFSDIVSVAEIGKIDIIEFLIAIKGIHFIMQNIVSEKVLQIVEVEKIEKEESGFDEYDRENGYEDEGQNEENIWKSFKDIIDRIIKISIRITRNSYTQCMKEDIIELLDYLKFELDTINEN